MPNDPASNPDPKPNPTPPPVDLPKPPNIDLPRAPEPASPPVDPWRLVRHWARVLLARNPFYIISAALLLWSMRKLSLDSRIFHDEFPQLLFNFSSFQVYELLLAGTAAVLASRRVWYDSGLLVGLENLFVCVPFLLVSQALLLDNFTAVGLCTAGCGLAVLRVGTMKRRLALMNMPAALLWPGAALLLFNFAWPALIRYLHKDLTVPDWDQRGLSLNAWEWNWIMPAAVALAVFLPVRNAAASLPPEEEAPFYAWRSFPFLALLMWIAGTCVHLYCISYVYGLPWRLAFLVPAIWVAAWVLWHQGSKLAPEKAGAACQRRLLFAPALVVLAATWTGRWQMCLTLAVLNTLACGGIAYLRRERVALHLCAVSMALVLISVPHPAAVRENVDLAHALWGSGLLYVVLWAIVSARPKLGIAGGVCLGLGLGVFLRGTAIDVNLAMQAGLIFILIHSLRWDHAGSSDVINARRLCAVYWLAHTCLWLAWGPSGAVSLTIICGVTVLVIFGCVRLMFGTWGPPVIAWSAGIVACLGPAKSAAEQLMHAPEGLLMLFASFALFGLGTCAALWKARSLARH